MTSNVDLTNYRLESFLLTNRMDQKLYPARNATANNNTSRALYIATRMTFQLK